jgi:SPW repeat-containing protein
MKRLPVPRIEDRRPLAAGGVSLWLAISPWLWGFADSHSAVANHVALVFGFGPLALLIANLRPAAFVTLLGGAWLAISPWLLGYATDHAAWVNELVTGLLLMVLCASAAGLHLPSDIRLAKRRARARALAETAGSRS